MGTLLPCRAWARIPASGVRLFLEVRTGPEWRRQIRRIHELRRHDEQCIAVRQIKAIEVFGQLSVRAIRHAILPQVAGLHAGRDHLQRAAAGGSAWKESTSSNRALAAVPRSDGQPLPAAARTARTTKRNRPCLRAGVRFKAECVVVGPADVQAPRYA